MLLLWVVISAALVAVALVLNTSGHKACIQSMGTACPSPAHDLVVALNTVKKHVTHVLGKLGAANRTEAADPGPPAGPDALTPHPSRPGSTFG